MDQVARRIAKRLERIRAQFDVEAGQFRTHLAAVEGQMLLGNGDYVELSLALAEDPKRLSMIWQSVGVAGGVRAVRLPGSRVVKFDGGAELADVLRVLVVG